VTGDNSWITGSLEQRLIYLVHYKPPRLIYLHPFAKFASLCFLLLPAASPRTKLFSCSPMQPLRGTPLMSCSASPLLLDTDIFRNTSMILVMPQEAAEPSQKEVCVGGLSFFEQGRERPSKPGIKSIAQQSEVQPIKQNENAKD